MSWRETRVNRVLTCRYTCIQWLCICLLFSFVCQGLPERKSAQLLRQERYIQNEMNVRKNKGKKNIPCINKSFFFFFLAFTLVFYILRITLTSCGFCTRVYNFFFFLFYFFFLVHIIYTYVSEYYFLLLRLRYFFILCHSKYSRYVVNITHVLYIM